jgi:preprotein translocase subunit SecG
MQQIIIVFHVLAAVAIIGLIMIQQGKGADMGASFGAGASQTLFGGRGSGNALTRATAILATIFFITSFALALVAKNHAALSGLIETPAAHEIPAQSPAKPVDDMPAVPQNAAPAADAKPANDMPAAPQQPQQ